MPEPSGPVRAVTFDVGGTLIAPYPSVGHVYAAAAARHACPDFNPSVINRRFLKAWRTKRDFEHSRRDWAELVRQSFGPTLPQHARELIFRDVYRRFARAASWKVFPDVRPTLEKLRSRGMRMAVISNWDHRLRPLLQELHLAEYFDVLVVSCEWRASKPAATLFATALQSLGLPPRQVVHVGDSFREDLQGARSAGMRALLLKRGAGSCGAAIGDLGRLPEFVARFNRPRGKLCA